jgi:hypothetical protein
MPEGMPNARSRAVLTRTKAIHDHRNVPAYAGGDCSIHHASSFWQRGLAILRAGSCGLCHDGRYGPPHGYYRAKTMRTLGLTLFGVAFICFMGVIFYALVDKMRTGVLFRQKKIVIPIAFGSWLLAVVGMLMLFLSQQ